MSIIRLFSSMSPEEAASMVKDDLNSFVRSELERAINEALDGEIKKKSICIDGDIGSVIHQLKESE